VAFFHGTDCTDKVFAKGGDWGWESCFRRWRPEGESHRKGVAALLLAAIDDDFH